MVGDYFCLRMTIFRWSSARCTAIVRSSLRGCCRKRRPCNGVRAGSILKIRAWLGGPLAKVGLSPGQNLERNRVATRGGNEEARRWTGLKHRTYTAPHWRSEDVPSPAYSGVKRNRRHIELPCITALGAVAHGRVWTIAAIPNTPHTWPTAKLLEEERKGRTRAKLTSEGSRFAACVGSKKTPDVLIHDLLDSGAGRWRRG